MVLSKRARARRRQLTKHNGARSPPIVTAAENVINVGKKRQFDSTEARLRFLKREQMPPVRPISPRSSAIWRICILLRGPLMALLSNKPGHESAVCCGCCGIENRSLCCASVLCLPLVSVYSNMQYLWCNKIPTVCWLARRTQGLFFHNISTKYGQI